MKHKTLFRLMLKAIGVWVCITGTSSVLAMVGTTLYLLLSRTPGVSLGSYYSLLGVLGPVFQIAAGLYLFFDGRWLTDRAIPSNRPYCHQCGYELTGASPASDLCPECGTPFRASAIPLAATTPTRT